MIDIDQDKNAILPTKQNKKGKSCYAIKLNRSTLFIHAYNLVHICY